MKICSVYSLLLVFITLFHGCEYPSGRNPAGASDSLFCATRDSLLSIDSRIFSVKTKNPEQAATLAQQAVMMAHRAESDSLLAYAYMLKGVIHRFHHEDSAYFFFNEALALCKQHGFIHLMPGLLYNLANIYASASDLQTEIRLLDSCIHLARQTENYVVLSNAYNLSGTIKFGLHDSADARRLLDSAFTIAKRENLNGQIGVSLASLAHLESDPEKSMPLLHEALKFLETTHGFDEEKAAIFINIGTDASHPDTAISYLEKGIETLRLSQSPKTLMAAYNNLAYSYIEKNNIQKAESCLKDYAIPIAEKTQDYDWLSTLYDSYMDVKLAAGDVKNALYFEQKALRARIEANQQQAVEQVRLLSALLESRNKEIQIQKSQAEILNQRNRTQWIIGWFSSGILFILVIVFWILWKMQRKHLADQVQMLVSARKLIESEEARKGRIAIELHDMITPFYYGMMQKLESSGIHNDQVKTEFEKTLSGLSSALRELSHRMNSDFIKQFDINELIQGLCDDFQKATRINIQCKYIQSGYAFSEEEKLHVYRILQELFSNAVKHVRKGTVVLTFSETPDRILFMYRDDGPGFTADPENQKGLGTTSIHERARLLKGKALLHTAPGNGTSWTISIPKKSKETS